MQDMLAEIVIDNAVFSPVQPPQAPLKYAFKESARIALAFFDPPSLPQSDKNLDR